VNVAVSRREFLELGAGGLAFLATSGVQQGLTVAPTAMSARLQASPWVETDVRHLQRLMWRGKLSSRQLTQGYLNRIARLNPTLHAVLETNPDALRIARHRDYERRHGHVRGPLHGIPVIVKDNIATADRMETTAGSLALVGSEVPADAPLVRQLRSAGAVLLGKANLSEWANFRGGNAQFPPINGWSARGGFTRNPYVLSQDPSGSSSGSAAAVAASMCAVAVGTETDGSILSPSAEQSLVGIKPTVGLVSGRGIIPIAHSQDTAGPMARSMSDAALLLDAIRVPGHHVLGHRVPRTYTHYLRRDGLVGANLAYDQRYVDGPYGPGDDAALEIIDHGLDRMRRAGATITKVTSVDPAEPDASGRIPFDDEFTVLLFEFKVQIAEYLSRLQNTRMRTLADLIGFNRAHCGQELRWFGQEVFELAEGTSGNLRDPEYLAAKATSQKFGRGVINGLLRRGFDAVITPSGSFGTSPAAVAGYPSMSIPVGYTPAGRPVGLWFASGFMREPQLIRIGYAVEQVLMARRSPKLRGSVPPTPEPFPGCSTIAMTPRSQETSGTYHGASGELHRRTW
jgi:amidase